MVEFLSRTTESIWKLMNCKQTKMVIHLVARGKLAEFDQDTVRGFGVNECDFRVVSARSGFLVDQRRSLLKIGLHLCFDIIDLKTDVMDPLAFGF